MARYTVTGGFRRGVGWYYDPNYVPEYSWKFSAKSDNEALYVGALISQSYSAGVLTSYSKTSYDLPTYAKIENTYINNHSERKLDLIIDKPEAFLNGGYNIFEYDNGSRPFIYKIEREDGHIVFERPPIPYPLAPFTAFYYKHWSDGQKIKLSQCNTISFRCPNLRKIILYYARLFQREYYSVDKMTFNDLLEASHSDCYISNNFDLHENKLFYSEPPILAVINNDTKEFILRHKDVMDETEVPTSAES